MAKKKVKKKIIKYDQSEANLHFAMNAAVLAVLVAVMVVVLTSVRYLGGY